VALRLICEREDEIDAFRPREYWSVEGQFTTPAGATFAASLSRLDGKKLQKFDLASEADAKRALAAIEARQFAVESVEKKQVQRHPAPPFATSTLQQEDRIGARVTFTSPTRPLRADSPPLRT
jgi:DNA topoisomerase-1